MTQDLYKQKKALELSWEQEYNESGRYTINMVEIDEKIKSTITQIKLAESHEADLRNKIEDSKAQVSIATQSKKLYTENVSESHNRLHSKQKRVIKNYYTINRTQTRIFDGLETAFANQEDYNYGNNNI